MLKRDGKAVAHAVVAEDIAVIPELLDNIRGGHANTLQLACRKLPSPIYNDDV